MRGSLVSVLIGVTIVSLSGCGGGPDDNKELTGGEDRQTPWSASGSGAVTDVYGLARIKPGDFYVEAKTKPWSSWWFPKTDTALFEPMRQSPDTPSPLQKYDAWAKKAKGIETHATDFERKVFETGITPEPWAGLCNAWAKAAVMEPEPNLKKPVEIDGVRFTTFDLKALLIKSYENTQGFREFGQRYNGTRNDDYNDIYPDQFHRFVMATLFEKGQPFIMDVDAGIPVWNYPVYKAQIGIAKDPSNPNVMHVHSTMATAGTRDDPGFVGTWQVNYEYYYDLYGVPMADGTFEVRSGAWTGESLDNHPDFVTELPLKSMHYSDNTEVKTDLIDEIIKKVNKPQSLIDVLFP